MNIFTSFFRKKSYPYDLKILKDIARSFLHPEKHKSKDALRSTQDADALRRTNDLVSSYIKAVKLGAIGEGLTLQYKSPDEELNNKVEAWLKHWSEVGNCEINGLTFRQEEERNMVAEYAVKGGYLVIHHWDKKLPTLYNFEFASCDEIDRTKNDFSKGLYNGIQTGVNSNIRLNIADNLTTAMTCYYLCCYDVLLEMDFVSGITRAIY
jgi:hypothetical protein